MIKGQKPSQAVVDEFLLHYGVPGMRWGVRKGRSNKSSASKGKSSKKKKKKPKASELTDAQLRTAVQRMNLERQYKELQKYNSNPGSKFVGKVAKTTLTAAATQQAAKAVSKAMP